MYAFIGSSDNVNAETTANICTFIKKKKYLYVATSCKKATVKKARNVFTVIKHLLAIGGKRIVHSMTTDFASRVLTFVQ